MKNKPCALTNTNVKKNVLKPEMSIQSIIAYCAYQRGEANSQ